ncbi:glycosyltransferase family 39 protein [Candidatus Pacearchaeota archaeon]|jgi:asparagine N-glycosylation enzyme membrane subunit Stt3|nr:glycosyltransferase family 39 protein [Candidatus Pacearchaeota archaeon]
MFQKTKQILKGSFYQLLVVYTLLIILISLNLFWKYSLQFQIFAVVLAVLGIFLTSNLSEKPINKKLHYILFGIAIFFIILTRVIPYIGNSIPLGYDAGIYKYGIEYGLKNLDNWILQGGHEPLFLYMMEPLKIFFSTQTLLTYGLIFFSVLLGISIYFVTKEFFNKTTGIIALLIYSVSSIQFLTFTYMYYRNILGLTLALFSIYFLKKSEKNKNFIWLFILLGGLLGAIHRPTFYIFGLSYLLYVVTSPFKDKKYNFNILKKNIFCGLGILLVAGLFYIGKFKQAILVMIDPLISQFIQTGESSGTFINFFTYQFSVLAYLPFALIGIFILFKKRKFNLLLFWALVTSAIVYFQLFFFNRFIIHLDIALIILSAYGFSLLIENKKKLGTIILIALLLSSGFVTLNQSVNTQPLITEQEFNTIKYLQNTETDSYVMSTSSNYSPWILGYSERKTIAPGLFDYGNHTQEEWIVFWTTEEISQIKEFMKVYPKPLYLFVGSKQNDNFAKFSECFEIYYQEGENKIYKYLCE